MSPVRISAGKLYVLRYFAASLGLIRQVVGEDLRSDHNFFVQYRFQLILIVRHYVIYAADNSVVK
jgi:hypothetical protein